MSDTSDLRITEDDRNILLGFDGRRKAAISDAQQEAHRLVKQAHEQINAQQSAYLGRLAERLGISAEDLSTKHRINLDTLTVERAVGREERS